MKILAFYILLLVSCSNVPPEANAQDDIKDSIASRYIELADSFPYFDTTDVHYKLLKAHIGNDTSYIRKKAEDLGQMIESIPKELLYDSCAKVPSLFTLGADEAYRFAFEEAFNAYKTNITVLQSNAGAHLRFLIYKPKASEVPCELIDEYDKALTSKQWEEIKRSLQYADFWGLHGANGSSGLDGGSLYVDGFQKGRNGEEDQLHRVYRWNPSGTAIWETYELIYRLSGFKPKETR